ncbi:MAG: hypothetical protein MUE92_09790 [Chloroflexi bacterium]|jgi:hypothetical protein|nr:hypothetical protein [Chloroflexota bacterium]
MRMAGRPFGILVLAALAILSGLWSLAAAAGLRPLDDYTIGSTTLPSLFPQAGAAAWAAMLLASAVLLLALHRWGWTLLMLATGLGLFGALWQWWIGNLEPVRMLVLVATAFYLNAREVRELLLSTVERTTAIPLAPPEGGRR